MYRHKLVLGIMPTLGIAEEAQPELFHRVGFDGYFVGWHAGKDISAIFANARAAGLFCQSIHAPFHKMRHMWYPSEETDGAVDELIGCLHTCDRYGVPLMITHTFIGFKDHTPTEAGIENYEKVVREAEKLGVKIAFENTEGEEYLAALMQAFGESKAVGFCWDTGHEMCYNHSKDMLALYGDKLLGTHINDNLGIRDFGGEITYLDDFHLLPFDGVGDWQFCAERLCRHGFTETLTFELSPRTSPGGVCKYGSLSAEEYVAEAYVRACRVAALCDRYALEKS